MKPRITSSIVLYSNESITLIEAINSFLNTNIDVRLYLIDNSPTDSLRSLKIDSRIEYIHNPSNPGFGAAHNMAIRRSYELHADYHLVLNPDIYYAPGTLEKLVQFMDSSKDIGLAMPKILYPNGEFQYLCKKNPTLFDLFARSFMPDVLKNLFKKRLDRFTYKEANFSTLIYDVPYLSGCFMLFRRSTLNEVGLFDEKIFMYLEDADITRRFLEVSRTVYYPEVTVFHHYGGLTHKKWKYKCITIQSAFIYFNKWGWFRSLY
jgi:GT2 family glycosyltransferase